MLIVVIPAFREVGTIGDVVTAVRPQARVIVVDDASGDGTAEAAEAAGAQVIQNKKNRGYEGALNIGFAAAAEAGASAILTMDGDGEHGPEYVATFSRLLMEEKVPLVLGCRPHTQRLAEAIVGGLIMLRYGVSDVFCGMKGYHTELWRRHGCFDSHNSIGTELALAAIRGGVPFREVPVRGVPRADAPRFDSIIRANLRIAKAITRCFSVPAVRLTK